VTTHTAHAAVIVPTFNAAGYFPQLSAALARLDDLRRDQVLIVDSSSSDQTADLFRQWGATVEVIPQSEFDHGGTRRLASELVPAAQYLVFLTQDAIPASAASLERLLAAFDDPTVGMAYGCQLPRPEAEGIERHARLMNYPQDVCEVRSLQDRFRLGIKTVFCSDSFAAYRRIALEMVGGMPKSAFFAEDQIVAGRMLLNGWCLAYQGNAKVTHSHHYSITQDFKRYFDVGVFHSRNPWLLREFGKAEGEGARFVKSELSYLWSNDRTQLPAAAARTFAKYAGYRLGQLERHLGRSVKRRLSMAPHYWAK
jgi:rhamnosyltransferase